MDLIPKFIGAPVQRREDPSLVTGEADYVGDINLPGTLHMAVARVPAAHAQLTDLEVEEARGAPGVRLVVTPEDVSEVAMPPRPNPERGIPRRYPLVQGRILMPGDPVAAVIAETPDQAKDAADLVLFDYELLEVVVDPEQALDAPVLHEELTSNVAVDWPGGDRQAFDDLEAPVVLQGTVEHPRVIPNPMETRAVLADWRGDRLDVHLSSQAPHLLADEIARSFGLPIAQVRVNTPYVGGGFGCKYEIAEEEYLAIVASRKLGAPVRWIESRREHMLAIGHGRAQIHTWELKADHDGRILGFWVDSLLDLGCRARYLLPGAVTPRMGTGNYDISVYGWRQRGVYTNRSPRGIYRGAGRPEAILTLERAVDRLATELGADPADIRRLNFVAKDAFPYRNPAGYVYDTGDYDALLDTLLDRADYAGLRATQEERRAAGRLMGIGLAAYVEVCAFEDWEAGSVRTHRDGSVTVSAGTSDQGQGHRTAYAQVAGDALGVPLEIVTVSQGDTATAPWGYGTAGSRSVSLGGSAIYQAAQEVADKARQIAAHLLEAAPGDIVLADGQATVSGTDVSVTWRDIARTAHAPRRLPDGMSPGLEAETGYRSGGRNFPSGVALAVVEVDADSGSVQLLSYWAVDDVGRVVNPMLADGQRHGGIAQGLGQALWEEARYDSDGNLRTASLMDYLLPSAAQMPSFDLDTIETLSPTNPLGVKGVGELGTIGSTAAVLNAVIDALAPVGVTDLQVPLSPEKVWRAIQASGLEGG
ncbi:MAG: xanthine dehydrogenase family protein molybdopterin-binding subunit [Acidimicrobiia bacterium]